ncbi:MAG: phenylacetate--CoA ligase family protein [Oscillospiraceae bacterium]|nr:phenylacetate--CoA ligase family protein [Oscillospiraceae bacterium]
MSGRLERIYDHAPIWMQNLMCSVSGWRKYRRRYGGAYWKARSFCEEFDAWPLERQLEYQSGAMRELIRYAAAHSEFYRALYKDVDLDSIRTTEDLKKLPIVDKEMLRANLDRIYTLRRTAENTSNTGGTTGKSLTVLSKDDDNQTRMAVLDHFKSRVGFENLKMRRATFNGKHIIPPGQKRHVYWRYNKPCKQMIYSSFDLTEEKLGYYVKSLNRFQPQAIDGFFTSICDVARYIERHRLTLSFRPVAVFPTSETLTAEGRALIERVFGCKVYDQYASSEGAPFVTECPCQRLHVELNTGVFEIQENGEILVTSFSTHGTPLIRYAIGDVMVPGKPGESCPCGLHGPLIREIRGRRLDYLLRSDGAKINAGNVSNLLKYMPNNVIRAQFRQQKLGELRILLELAEGGLDEAGRREILSECRHTLGPDTRVSIEVVPEIPREKSGKFRMIVNEVRI